ncbi:E3 ubiquitin-protein ligase ORTHRUS 2-like [Malania oleifera]|uniref:E3 ubiquitin-protein ligase ORTHRUS 2-like n=1 Tax=Malania oleifera TaxID=397392 RepID=UPI0025AE916D|nr:E3 ubiquitin-protein ligase ORTHRUS 2-like [Malania oleifera]
MAHDRHLPCDGDGICMVCKEKPPADDNLACKTCASSWHVQCLSFLRPQTLADALRWECPDCALPADPNPPPILGGAESSGGDLILAIRAIESDRSLSEQEKARRRQQLVSGGAVPSEAEKDREKKTTDDDEILEIFDESLNCSFCMQMPERPVTTPCGHNFCLKCFQKWIGQGKRTCANCRNEIPTKMANQPRINSALVIAIRMAKLAKSSTVRGPPKVYHYVHNQSRPDKAYTTERAKKPGKANACSGKIFVTVPPDHFGPILAENDPLRNQGVLVGESWEDRLDCRQWGAHLPPVGGIAGQSKYGAQSVALSGGYEDDEDHGEWFLYTGSGGRDLSGNKRTNKEQSSDQEFEKYNEALRVSCREGYPVRVVRSHKEKRSSYAPETGVRYDGIYRIEKCWRKAGTQGFKMCRYLFVRCDNEPAPWTSDEHGDHPRPLPIINELRSATDITERKATPSWDYHEEKDCWMWKKTPPHSRKQVDGGNSRKRNRTKSEHVSMRDKLLKEFSCLICRKVMTLPLTTPCAHNFCKGCLEGVFAGQSFMRQRTCEGRRTLRAQKNIMKCPSCSNDISDFLKNPQVNRELMGVIESLQRRAEEADEIAELSSEGTNSIEQSPDEIAGEGEICNTNSRHSEETKGVIPSPLKRKKANGEYLGGIKDETNAEMEVTAC